MAAAAAGTAEVRGKGRPPRKRSRTPPVTGCDFMDLEAAVLSDEGSSDDEDESPMSQNGFIVEESAPEDGDAPSQGAFKPSSTTFMTVGPMGTGAGFAVRNGVPMIDDPISAAVRCFEGPVDILTALGDRYGRYVPRHTTQLYVGANVEAGGLEIHTVDIMDKHGDVFKLGTPAPSIECLRVGDTDVRAACYEHDPSTHHVVEIQSPSALGTLHHILQIADRVIEADSDTEMGSEIHPPVVDEVLQLNHKDLVSNYDAGMVDDACRGVESKQYNIFTMGHVDKHVYAEQRRQLKRTVATPVAKAINWLMTTAVDHKLSHSLFACIEAIEGSNKYRYNKLLAAVRGAYLVYVGKQVVDKNVARICGGFNTSLHVLAPRGVDVANTVELAARDFEANFDAFEIQKGGGVELQLCDASATNRLDVVVKPLLMKCQGVCQLDDVPPISRDKRRVIDSSDDDDEPSGNNTEVPSDRSQTRSPNDDDVSSIPAWFSAKVKTPRVESNHAVIVNTMPDDDVDAYIQGSFRDSIISCRNKYAEFYGFPEGHQEPWVTAPKFLSKWTSQCMELATLVFQRYVETAIGVLVDSDDGDTIVLSSGLLRPRKVALSHTEMATSAKDKAFTPVTVESVQNRCYYEKLTLAEYPMGLQLIHLVEYFWGMLIKSNVFHPDEATEMADVDHTVAFLPEQFKSITFARSTFLPYLTGSDKSDGVHAGAVLSKLQGLGVRTEPLLMRFTFACRDQRVVSFTNDEGLTATMPHLIEADGSYTTHAYIDKPIGDIEAILRAGRDIVKTAIENYADDNADGDLAADILKPLIRLLCMYAPEYASLIMTQYAQRDPESMYDPNDVLNDLDTLSDDEMIQILYCCSVFVRPFCNFDTGQQICSIQGVGGSSKSTVINCIRNLFNGGFVKLPDDDSRTDFWAAPFWYTNQCRIPGVYRYVAFLTEDRKNRSGGARILQYVRNQLLGYSSLQPIEANEKNMAEKRVEVMPFGVYDQGNGAPREIVDKVVKEEISAVEALQLTVAGEAESIGGNGIRRISIAMPWMVYMDPGMQACTLKTRTFDSVSALEGDACFMFVLVSIFANLALNRFARVDHVTELYAKVAHEWVMMNVNNVREAAEAHFEKQPDEVSIKLTSLMYGDATIKVANVVPLVRLQEKMTDVKSLNEFRSIFGAESTTIRPYGCSYCGLAFFGKRPTALRTHIADCKDNNPDNNVDLMTLLESACEGAPDKCHVFGRVNTSPRGFRLHVGGCIPVTQMI